MLYNIYLYFYLYFIRKTLIMHMLSDFKLLSFLKKFTQTFGTSNVCRSFSVNEIMASSVIPFS